MDKPETLEPTQADNALVELADAVVQAFERFNHAEHNRHDCPECENDGAWWECEPCSETIGDLLDAHLLAIEAYKEARAQTPADATDAEGVALSEQQRAFLENILVAGGQARPNLYRLFDAGRQVRAVADKMYWAVREDDSDAFKAAMTEYEQVVGLNFTAPDVQLRPFSESSARPPKPEAIAGEATERLEASDIVARYDAACWEASFRSDEASCQERDVARKELLTALSRTSPPAKAEVERLREQCADLQMQAFKWMDAHDKLKAGQPYSVPAPADLPSAYAEVERLRSEVINTPETADFMAGVPIEATHQRERWGSDHDAGKTPFDWFWLVGYLAQKAAASAVAGDTEKAKHHTISTAAALANWHAALTGADNRMVPGAPLPIQAEGDAALSSTDQGESA